MKHFFTILTLLISINITCQTLKMFNGPFSNGKMQNGSASYTYYEDPDTREYVKHGKFTYTFNGTDSYSGYNQTIYGSFENGLKHGLWTYKITMTDFGNGNPYFTGTITLVANYKNGYAHGNWKEIRSYKSRKRYYGKWEPFDPIKTMTIDMNFNEGYLAGSVNINDEFSKFKAIGNYDNNGFAVGKWVINDIGWGKNKELIYMDNFLYEFISRNNQGEVEIGSAKYETDFNDYKAAKLMTQEERENKGFEVVKNCETKAASTSNIQEYFNKLLNNDYFLYEFIKGDLTYKEGIKGGCEYDLRKTNFISLNDSEEYKLAEELSSKNKLGAYDYYNKIDLKLLRPSDKEMIEKKISILKPDIYKMFSEYESSYNFLKNFIKNQKDSIQIIRDFLTEKIPLITFTSSNGELLSKNLNGQIYIVHTGFCYKDLDCVSPWNNRNWECANLCLKDNSLGIYSPLQFLATKYFFEYIEKIELEENAIGKSNYKYNFEDKDYYYNSYSKEVFLKNILDSKSNIEKVIKSVEIQSNYNKKIEKINLLNLNTKKKVLFSKFKIIIDNQNKIFIQNKNLDDINNNLLRIDKILDKIITLYSTETTELEKKLKEIKGVIEIENNILNF